MNELNYRQVILEVGAEGGSITLWGREASTGRWLFAVGTNESAAMELLDDEDAVTFETPDLRWTDNWQEAVKCLDAYPWQRLCPLVVHPEFRDRIRNVLQGKHLEGPYAERWEAMCGSPTWDKTRVLADWLLGSKYTVALTGAGMSTESGVPDFRSPSGWWRNVDPRTVATVTALEENYPLFHAFYTARIQALEGLKPNDGHTILAQWEQHGLIHSIATQNVDGFHQMAGSQNVYELHGSIRTCRCGTCGKAAKIDEFLAASDCQDCGGPLRPNVVLFGESLPETAWNQAVADIEKADLVIVIGTSLSVYPANQLPSMAKGKIAVINLEPTEMDGAFDLIIHGEAAKVLRRVNQALFAMEGEMEN